MFTNAFLKTGLLFVFLLSSLLTYGQSEVNAQKHTLWTWNTNQRTGEYLRTPDWTAYGFSFWANGAERMYLYSDQLLLRVPANFAGPLRVEQGYSQGSGNNFDVDSPGVAGGRMRIHTDGNVSIGTPWPAAKITVEDADPSTRNGIVAAFRRQGAGDVGLSFTQSGLNSYGIVHLAGTGSTGGGLGFFGNRYPGAAGALHMMIDNGGAVLIGSDQAKFTSLSATSKSLYGLWVEKGVVANDYAVEPKTAWSDFVFEAGYQLRPLGEVEKFIRRNGHLPQVPSAAEIRQNGYTVHGINTTFLQKIEELTLYAIEQEKKAIEQEKKITSLETQLAAYKTLAEEVEKIKALVAGDKTKANR
ncbi:MAG: hypothetical protein ICV83_10220 [Cytophagales bacterium]|nr:hypothetical protein [Cytophagales bacterium]